MQLTVFVVARRVVHRRSDMSGTNESNAIIIDSDEEQEVMDLQESVTQEDATCFATCSSATCSSASGRRVGNEATISSTNTKDCEAEGIVVF